MPALPKDRPICVPRAVSDAELQARDPDVVFVADQVGYSATTWYSATGSRLGGRLSDDVSAADVTVVEIASSIAAGDGATYPGC
jgi:hypothetical protein